MESSSQQIPVVLLILLIIYPGRGGLVPVAGFCRFSEPVNGSLQERLFPVRQYHRQVLEKSFGYYQQLNAANKRRFESRVAEFLADKEFIRGAAYQ